MKDLLRQAVSLSLFEKCVAAAVGILIIHAVFSVLLMQSVRAERYIGKKVRLSGLVKSQEVVSWAGLWMRVDKGKDMVVFDNMQDRPIKGTTDWQRYDMVLDVPPDSTGISFGILLDGAGKVWLSGTKFDVVGADVPSTGAGDRKIPDNPVNLDFTESGKR